MRAREAVPSRARGAAPPAPRAEPRRAAGSAPVGVAFPGRPGGLADRAPLADPVASQDSAIRPEQHRVTVEPLAPRISGSDGDRRRIQRVTLRAFERVRGEMARFGSGRSVGGQVACRTRVRDRAHELPWRWLAHPVATLESAHGATARDQRQERGERPPPRTEQPDPCIGIVRPGVLRCRSPTRPGEREPASVRGRGFASGCRDHGAPNSLGIWPVGKGTRSYADST